MKVGRWSLLSVALVSVAAVTFYAFAADDADSLRKKRNALENKEAEVFRQLGEFRRGVEKADTVVAAQKALNEARAAYEAKLTSSARYAAAKKNLDELLAASKATADAESTNNPEVLAAIREAESADDAAFELDSQLRVAEFVLAEMKRKTARDPELAKLKAAEAKALEAFYAARQANQGVETAKSQREAATKAFDDAVTARLAASADGAAQLKKVADLEARAKAARQAAPAALAKVQTVKASVLTDNPKLVEYREVIEIAQTSLRDTAVAEAGPERDAYDQAQRALEEAVRVKMEADPKVVDLRNQLDGVRAEMRELSAKAK
jgi:hypothetical protein